MTMKILRYSLAFAAAALTSAVFIAPVQADETPVATTQPITPEVDPFAATVPPSPATSAPEQIPARAITSGQENETLVQAPDGIRWQLVNPATGEAGKPFLLPAYQPGLSKTTRIGERFAYIGHIRRADRMQLACISFNLNKGLVTFRQDSTLFASSDGDSGDAPSFSGDGYAASCHLKGERCNTLGTCDVAEENISIGRNSTGFSSLAADNGVRYKKVCRVSGKGRNKVTKCRSVAIKSTVAKAAATDNAANSTTTGKKVCSVTGKGRHKVTKCRTVKAKTGSKVSSKSTKKSARKTSSKTGKSNSTSKKKAN